MNTSAYLFVNLFNDGDKMTLYVDGLLPQIRTVVACYREDQPHSPFNLENLEQYALDEGEAYQSRTRHVFSGPIPVLNTVTLNFRTVTFK